MDKNKKYTLTLAEIESICKQAALEAYKLADRNSDKNLQSMMQQAAALALKEYTTQKNGKLVVSRNEAMQMLDIGKDKLAQLINDGHLDTVKAGRKVLIKVKSINNFLEK